MHREFGLNARIVGIADGTGSAEDPVGLDLIELLRLVDGDAASHLSTKKPEPRRSGSDAQ